MAQTVIGIFDSSAEAQQAVQQLKSIGITEDRIDVSSASTSTSGATTSGTTPASGNNYSQDNDSIGGFFRSLFSDDDDQYNRYSGVARHSDCLVTVHAQSTEEAERAADILDQYGSVDVNERATQYGYGSNSYGNTGMTGASVGMENTGMTDTNLGTGTGITDTNYTNTTDSTSIPIIEENLQVGKREVETGGARLRSRIVERPVEEHLRLRSEHIRVERRAVDRPATEADFSGFREGDIEMREHAEVPIVNKEARVVEEVSLGKEVSERDEVIRDTVRSTEVDIDQRDATTDRTRLNTDTDLDNDRNTAL